VIVEVGVIIPVFVLVAVAVPVTVLTTGELVAVEEVVQEGVALAEAWLVAVKVTVDSGGAVGEETIISGDSVGVFVHVAAGVPAAGSSIPVIGGGETWLLQETKTRLAMIITWSKAVKSVPCFFIFNPPDI
jgi:hypothetical protein